MCPPPQPYDLEFLARVRTAARVDKPRRRLGGFALVAGEDVAVDLESEGDVGVAEAFADHSRVLAHCK